MTYSPGSAHCQSVFSEHRHLIAWVSGPGRKVIFNKFIFPPKQQVFWPRRVGFLFSNRKLLLINIYYIQIYLLSSLWELINSKPGRKKECEDAGPDSRYQCWCNKRNSWRYEKSCPFIQMRKLSPREKETFPRPHHWWLADWFPHSHGTARH